MFNIAPLQMPNTALIRQEIETESELEEERVPTPEVMKKEDEDLDTDQVRSLLSNLLTLLSLTMATSPDLSSYLICPFVLESPHVGVTSDLSPYALCVFVWEHPHVWGSLRRRTDYLGSSTTTTQATTTQ